jgi:hypothetical protein
MKALMSRITSEAPLRSAELTPSALKAPLH